MSFATVGGAVLGGVASAVVGSALSGSNSPSNNNSSASTAEGPFFGNNQAQQYQQPLANLVQGQGATQGGATQYNSQIAGLANTAAGIGSQNAKAVQNGQGTNAAQNQLIALMSPGTDAASQLIDPGYQFLMSQGTNAIDRSAAANGSFGSGGEAAELEQFGQGLANETYNSQISDLETLSNSLSNSQNAGLQAMGQGASAYSGLNAAAANDYSNQYQQLAALSGANIGNPAVAGQIQQTANANTAAFAQNITNPLVNAATGAISGLGANSTNTAYQAPNQAAVDTGNVGQSLGVFTGGDE